MSPANWKPSGDFLIRAHRIISVTAFLAIPLLANLYAICFFLQAFCSVSAVLVNSEKPSGGFSFSPIIRRVSTIYSGSPSDFEMHK